MDINYLLEREQISLRRAATSGSRSARAVHQTLARGYGLLLDASTFPHAIGPASDQIAVHSAPASDAHRPCDPEVEESEGAPKPSIPVPS